MRIGHYSASVVVDGKELEEYHIQFVTPTRATCWIASEEGKAFSIVWTCHNDDRTKGCAGWVTIDGVFCGGVAMHPEDSTAEMDALNTDTSSHPFMFSKINLSDDERLLNRNVPQGFGEISLEIEHGKLVPDRPGPRKKKAQNTIVPVAPKVEDDIFHESSSKAARHRVSFGPPTQRDDSVASRLIVNLDDETSLFFVFQFRPIALLQAHELVPSLPVPEASDAHTDRNASPKPDPDMLELQERIQNAKNELERLQELKAQMSQRIKTEGSVPLKQAVPEMIDLTRD